MKRLSIAVWVALIGFAPACGRSTTAPTPPSASNPTPRPPAPPIAVTPKNVLGHVADTAFRPMAGVKMVVLNGPEAGTEMVSDSEGRFSYTGTFGVTVSVRATKDGYADATQPVFPSTTSDLAWVSFRLAPLTPPTQVATAYTLTITADSACSALPGDVRTRSYSASVRPVSSTTTPANTYFNGVLSGARFAPFANIFWIGVAGDYVVVTAEGEGPSIVENLGQNRYVAYYGSAAASVGSAGLTAFSAPFNGVIEYCELAGSLGPYYDCTPGPGVVVREQCTSKNSQLSLVRDH
jgi:hypothetical protein